MIPIIKNQNNPHPMKNVTGEIFDHFFTVMIGVTKVAGAEEVVGVETTDKLSTTCCVDCTVVGCTTGGICGIVGGETGACIGTG